MAMTNEHIQLVVAAQKGDINSFEELYVIYYGKIYAFAKMILKNERDAEDVLQKTFITAWRKLNTLQNHQTFSVWLQIIARNLCNDQLKRKSITILLDAEKDIENFEDEASDELIPAVYAERTDLKDRLGQIIEGLSEVHRQAIVLYYFNELAVEEISDIIQCSPGTVKSRLYFARKAIRTEIEEHERKTGQKFYGVAGIPLLPLGKLIKLHMEILSMGQSAANASLSAVKNSISTSNAAAAAPGTAGTNAAFAAAKSASTALRIIVAVAVAAIVGAATLFSIVLVFGYTNNTNTPGGDDSNLSTSSAVSDVLSTEVSEQSGGGVGFEKNGLLSAIAGIPGKNSLDELYSLISGYWIMNGRPFVYFFKDKNGAHQIEYGLYETSFSGGGRITGGKSEGTYKAELIIFDPGLPANEVNDGRPASNDTVLLDFGDFYKNGTIKIKIEKLGSGEWYTYKSGGGSLETAYD